MSKWTHVVIPRRLYEDLKAEAAATLARWESGLSDPPSMLFAEHDGVVLKDAQCPVWYVIRQALKEAQEHRERSRSSRRKGAA